MDLSAAQQGYLAVGAVVVALLALALAVAAQLRLGRVRRDFRVLWGDGEATDVARLGADQQRRILALAREVGGLGDAVAATRSDVGRALRHVAVVRYDAFADMGGRLSFSCALVDDEGDGLVLSSIHARAESRTYAKGIVGGASEVTLTPEEQQALGAARADGTRGTPRPTTRPTTRPAPPPTPTRPEAR